MIGLDLNQLESVIGKLTPAELAELDELLEGSGPGPSLQLPLRDYIKQAWPIIEPMNRFMSNWHIDLITEYLESVSQGKINRLAINLPPRNMKSISVSVMWPTWEWTKMPWTRWLFASYAGSLSIKHSVDRRTLITSRWYQIHWGTLYQLTGDQNTKTEYQNDHRGVMTATSVGGTATGKGGSRIVADDLLNPEESESDLDRESSNRFFRQTLQNRLDNKQTDALVVVMQRLHIKDVTAEAKELGYEILSIPAEQPTAKTYIFPISKRKITREAGEILWAERDSAKVLQEQKVTLGTRGYSAQYLQEPSTEEGDLGKRKWWRRYKKSDLPDTFDDVILSWDMAFKDLKTSSYVCGQCWARKGSNKYLLGQRRAKLDFVKTIISFTEMMNDFPLARLKLVEGKANGSAVISVLKDKIPGIVEVEPEGSKSSRAYSCTPDIEAGNVWLPDDSYGFHWVHEFIEEWATAPGCHNWDQIDAATQALQRLRTKRMHGW